MIAYGPCHRSVSACEPAYGSVIPLEPWLLPISDSAPRSEAPEDVALAVSNTSRRLWRRAYAACLALGGLLAVEATTGWILSPAPVAPLATAPVRAAQPS